MSVELQQGQNSQNNQRDQNRTSNQLSFSNKKHLAELQSLTMKFKRQDSSLLLEILPKLTSNSEDESLKLNSSLQKLLNSMLMKILEVETHQKTSRNESDNFMIQQTAIAVLKQFLEAICKCSDNKAIKKSVVISLIENILECLGVSDLSQILRVISEQICSFGSSLEESDQYKLLRIINHLLKRISKTQDYSIRGELQFALTKFLPICHDSGFHYRTVTSKTSQLEKNGQRQDEDIVVGLSNQDNNGVTYEFFESFWELQKYYMDINELSLGESGATPSKNARESLVTLRLKKIEQTLSQIIKYFNKNEPKQRKTNFYNQPLKFLKNFNLLTLQLDDSYFRKIIMLQTLIFTFSLRNQSNNKNVINLSQVDKKVIDQIEAISVNFLKESTIDDEEGRNVYEQFMHLLNNELFWIDLKDNWKEKKKNFFKKNEVPGSLTISNSLINEQSDEKTKQKVHHPLDLEKKRIEIKKQIAQKLKIDGTNLMKFLQKKDPISLLQSPSSTSFSYFYSQALSCLKTFDYETGKQTQFETRSQYNMFEWKAMRSLYRQNIKDIHNNSVSDKTGKLKQYRLISLLQRKEEQISDFEQIRKLVKQE